MVLCIQRLEVLSTNSVSRWLAHTFARNLFALLLMDCMSVIAVCRGSGDVRKLRLFPSGDDTTQSNAVAGSLSVGAAAHRGVCGSQLLHHHHRRSESQKLERAGSFRVLHRYLPLMSQFPVSTTQSQTQCSFSTHSNVRHLISRAPPYLSRAPPQVPIIRPMHLVFCRRYKAAQ